MKRDYSRTLLRAVCLILISCSSASAYGPVGHFRVVIENWDSSFSPHLNGETLFNRELVFAAMAGSVAADIGLVIPQGSSFTSWVHYVRSGDFVTALVAKARSDPYKQDPRFLAFALGFLSHYPADRYGHYSGTNELVALIKPAGIQRVTYERNTNTHMWVETQLGRFDLQEMPKILTAGFIEAVAKTHSELESPDGFLRTATSMMLTVVENVYPGTRLAFGAFDFYQYLLFVAGTLCLTADAIAEVFPPGSAPPRTVVCSEIFNQMRSQPGGEQSLSALRDAIGKPLSDRLPLDLVERIHHQSLDRVRGSLLASLADIESGRSLANFNLDTNLASKGGQYQCADSAFQKLVQARKSMRRPSAGQLEDIKKFDEVYNKYQKEGVETHKGFSGTPVVANLSAMANHSDLEDIAPQITSDAPLGLQSAAQCPSKVGATFPLGSEVFLLDVSKRVLCFPKTARSVEAVYAYAVAQKALSEGSATRFNFEAFQDAVAKALPRYLEAVERLRLGRNEKKHASTRLYQDGACGDVPKTNP